MIDKYEYLDDILEFKDYSNEGTVFFKLYKNCCICKTLKNNKIWEPHLHKIFEKYVTKNSVVLEAGCHIGTHSIKLAKICRELHCFEPLSYSFNLLKYNIELNKLHNVKIYNEGLSDKQEQKNYISITDGNPGGAVIAKNDEGKEFKCELTTIDSLNLKKIDFIKLDVEGYETLAIKGGINTIKKFKPIITIENWKDNAGSVDIEYTKEQFIDLLRLGYKLSHVGGPDFLFTFDRKIYN